MKNQEVYSYFLLKNINVIDKRLSTHNNLTYSDILKQIDTIALFHNRIGGYKENLIPRIGSNIGKDYEFYKLQIKRLYKEINYAIKKENRTLVEEYLILKGPVVVEYASKVIGDIEKSEYRNLIKRAMNNYEVCLGKVDESNLGLLDNNEINIGSIKYFNYNLIEQDFCNYIIKIKRRFKLDNIDELINRYIEKTFLDYRSVDYIKSFINFPKETFRIWEKLKNGQKYSNYKDFFRDFERYMNLEIGI